LRLWSLHPRHLDSKGLVALWREGLLAQKVLAGDTRGYTRHPQLDRFKSSGNASGAIATYLRGVVKEAERRGYKFNKSKIVRKQFRGRMSVTSGQLEFERAHLLNKLKERDEGKYGSLLQVTPVDAHPVFIVESGKVASWEVT